MIVLTNDLQQTGIRGCFLKIYEDKSNKIEFHEITSEKWKDSFNLSSRKNPIIENINATYWLKFTINNKATTQRKWLIEFFDHELNHVVFYNPLDHGRFKKIESGNLVDYYSRLYNHKNLEFDLELEPTEIKTYYFKIWSANRGVIVPEIRSYQRFISYALEEYFILGLFYGILAIMVVYNLFLFIALKNLIYFYYLLYIISVGLYTMCHNGIGFQYIWSSHPQLNFHSTDISIYLTMLFCILFTKKFLEFEVKFPLLNNLLNFLLITRSFWLIVNINFFPNTHFRFIDLIPMTPHFYIWFY